MKNNPSSVIYRLAKHPIAADLLMLLAFVAGLFAINQLNTQLLPRFSINTISISTVWPGANPEDVENAITIPIEQQLSGLDEMQEIYANSQQGLSQIVLEMTPSANMNRALNDVRMAVGKVKRLPQDAENPIIQQNNRYEEIARLVISADNDQLLMKIRPKIYAIERSLLRQGVSKIELVGMASQEIAVLVPAHQLVRIGQPMHQLGRQIQRHNVTQPGGSIGAYQNEMQIKSPQQNKSAGDIANMSIGLDDNQTPHTLGSIAKIIKRFHDRSIRVFKNQKPSVELRLLRTKNSDALVAADRVHHWLATQKPALPPGVTIALYKETWKHIAERIMVLVKNGGTGLLLILVLLGYTLSLRVAFWIAMGIPVAILTALFIMYVLGLSINMVSLFALIMTLGIIVDDTIVVAEESVTQWEKGAKPLQAVVAGAQRMLAPVTAASLTTVAAFLPLIMVRGIMGQILQTIPVVVITVVVASLIECFLVLPGHLKRAFARMSQQRHQSDFQKWIERFIQKRYRPFVRHSVAHAGTTLTIALAVVLLMFSLLTTRHVQFSFFPNPESKVLWCDVQFMAGTSEQTKAKSMQRIEQALYHATAKFRKQDPQLIQHVVQYQHRGNGSKGAHPNLSSIQVELISPDQRTTRNEMIRKAWRSHLPALPGVANIEFSEPREGPPGNDIDITLYGQSAAVLKQASLKLMRQIAAFPGVSDINDDLPYGQQQLVYDLTHQAKTSGLTNASLGQQIYSLFSGHIFQYLYQGQDELTARVVLPDDERKHIGSLRSAPIFLPNGSITTLENVANIEPRRGFDQLRRTHHRLSIRITAQVDRQSANSYELNQKIKTDVMPALQQKYPIQYEFSGANKDEKTTLNDMIYGAVLAISLIYLILAGVSQSYLWPLFVMISIPFGLAGAIFGHWILGIDITILSLFGFFGLAGIVVNDSIILLLKFKELIAQSMPIRDAITEASVCRFRAVTLTSLTTIAGLTPLLFERSLQAQFLIPMATSIVFGIATATVLILIVIPSMIELTLERWHQKIFKNGFHKPPETGKENS